MKNSELLIGVKSVCDEYAITEDQFYTFLGLGLPMRKINSRWYGHRDNISEFFRGITIGEPIQMDGKKVKEIAGGE